MSGPPPRSVEAAGQVVCAELAIQPNAWREFAGTIRKALAAAVDTLPPDLAETVRAHMELNP